MVEVVTTSEGVIPLNTRFGAPSFPLSVTDEARKFAEEHGFTVKEVGSDIILTNGDYVAKIVVNKTKRYSYVSSRYC